LVPAILKYCATAAVHANQGLGTRSIQAFMVQFEHCQPRDLHTEIAPQRFKGFWKD
jgi:hypothetical protein